MKNTIKGFMSGIAICVLLALSVALFAQETRTVDITYGVQVMLDGETIEFADDMQPFILDGRTYLPLRAVAELVELCVTFNYETSTVMLSRFELFDYSVGPRLSFLGNEIDTIHIYNVRPDFQPFRGFFSQSISRNIVHTICPYFGVENISVYLTYENEHPYLRAGAVLPHNQFTLLKLIESEWRIIPISYARCLVDGTAPPSFLPIRAIVLSSSNWEGLIEALPEYFQTYGFTREALTISSEEFPDGRFPEGVYRVLFWVWCPEKFYYRFNSMEYVDFLVTADGVVEQINAPPFTRPLQ